MVLTEYLGRTRDMALVRSIITHPTQWKWATDDTSPPMEEWYPEDDERIWRVAYGRVALFTFVPRSAVRYEMHCAVLPAAWGEAVDIGKAAIQYLFDNTEAKRVIAEVPAFNVLARRAAKAAGLEPFGVDSMAFLKDGRLHDMHLFGISKKV